MTRVLVTAACRYEATCEIAEAIAAALVRRGIDATAFNIEEVDRLDDYDVVVIGSAVYMGRWIKTARAFVERNAAALARRQVWLFSSGPLGAPEHLVPAGEPVEIEQLAARIGARAHRVFAGRSDERRLNLRERAIVRAVGAPVGDYRDWDAIEAFATEIAAALPGHRAHAA